MKKFFFATVIIIMFAGVSAAQNGVKQKRPKLYEYGSLLISPPPDINAEMPPVAFDHWVHRSKFTCRVCHTDIGFNMQKGTTDITAKDNMRGYMCGTCHNGKSEYEGKKIFVACSEVVTDPKVCFRCHETEKNEAKADDFFKFSENLPKEHLGNGIDWEKAENKGYIKPIDFIDGISVKRPPFAIQKDFALEPKVNGLPNIIFSHKKHTDWNGCEVCHPDIFRGIKKGMTKYSMADISEGKYCGVCHISVAFPLQDCQRCHTSLPTSKD